MVLEKILESPLDCKGIHPVHSKGEQSWVFFGRNDAEAETSTLCYYRFDYHHVISDQLLCISAFPWMRSWNLAFPHVAVTVLGIATVGGDAANQGKITSKMVSPTLTH